MLITDSGRQEKRTVFFVLGLGLVAVHLWMLTRLRFEVWPEMLVMPYLQQHRFELYRDMIVPWTPGLMWILRGWFDLVGFSVGRLKLFTWGLIAGIDLLILLIAKKRWGEKAGLAALLFFVLFQPIFDGNGLWFDLAVIPLLLLAFHWRSPLLLGPAFLIKQSAIWLIPAIIAQKGSVFLKVRQLLLGLALVIGFSWLWFYNRGTAVDFWKWAIDFTFLKLPQMPGHAYFAVLAHWIYALFPFGAIGLAASLKGRQHWGRFITNSCPLFWAAWAIMFAIPRFGLFHFQLAIAFLSLEAGHLFGYFIHKQRSRAQSIALATTILLLIVYSGMTWSRLLSANWRQPDRFMEPAVFQYSALVALSSGQTEPVLLVNGPELAYVLADRLPPKPWLTQFPWFLELPEFQEMLIDEFKQQNLRQVFLFPYQNEGEFIPGSYRPIKLLEYVDSIAQ